MEYSKNNLKIDIARAKEKGQFDKIQGIANLWPGFDRKY